MAVLGGGALVLFALAGNELLSLQRASRSALKAFFKIGRRGLASRFRGDCQPGAIGLY
jgi:hypothetical protein